MIKHFNYYLIGMGWAEVFFVNHIHNIRFEFSYLSDPLAELLKGLCRLKDSESEIERIVFAEEPGEHSLVISREHKDEIKVEIFWCNEWEETSMDLNTISKNELVYSDKDTLTNFITVICHGIENLLKRHTFDDYKEKWSLLYFPIEKYNKLKQVIK